MARFPFFKKKQPEIPADNDEFKQSDTSQTEPLLKPLTEEASRENNDLKIILTKLDILTVKVDNLDRRLQRIEEIAKQE